MNPDVVRIAGQPENSATRAAVMAVVEAIARGKCIRPLALLAVRTARCRSSRGTAGRFTVRSVTPAAGAKKNRNKTGARNLYRKPL